MATTGGEEAETEGYVWMQWRRLAAVGEGEGRAAMAAAGEGMGV